MGVVFYGARLDYAFHTFGGLAENDTHFFSLSYSSPAAAPKIPAPAAPTQEADILFFAPPNNLATFEVWVYVSGGAINPKDVKEVRINQKAVPGPTFATLVQLQDYGRNTIEAQVISQTGGILKSRWLNVVLLMSFSDIPADHPDRKMLGHFGALGYIKLPPDLKFNPNGYITTDQLSVLLSRIRPAPTAVKKSSKPVSRLEAVTMLTRFAALKEPKYIYEKPFVDIDVKNWAAKAVTLAKNEGWLDFLKGKRFRPAGRSPAWKSSGSFPRPGCCGKRSQGYINNNQNYSG